MTSVFVDCWKEMHSNDIIVYREVGQEDIPHVTEKWIVGAFKPSELRNAEDVEALRVSDKLVAELKGADIIVLGTPMYNWSIPSALKAYIDQVLRVNETILISKEDPKNPYKGLLKDKKVFLLMVRSNIGYEPGEFYEHMDFQTNYLKTVFRIMGIEDIEHVALNGVGLKEEALLLARQKVEQLINNQHEE
ncbi:NAD(P)H-dependent oxidoreductase [Sphingobacterium sp. SRCM116780]|nr:NAD(P)H-dependent oxidoreductase [Sphingobacterium sp. SRCM116780]